MKLEKIIAFKELLDYPSASGIEFYNDTLYLVGDDANSILMMNTRWENATRIDIFNTTENRITKKLKSDLEAITLVFFNSEPHLLILGSGSKELRNKAILIDIKTKEKKFLDIEIFYERLKSAGILDLNIEGVALVNNLIVLSNRGNKTYPDNYLIVTASNFWMDQQNISFTIVKTGLSKIDKAMGISGITYSQRYDRLLLTTSTENTPNAIDDGSIGKSCLCIIENFYRKTNQERIKIKESKIIDLCAADEKFKGYKIESVCIESEKQYSMELHLVADNDTGVSYLFKVRLKY
jgi:hypothetical protein